MLSRLTVLRHAPRAQAVLRPVGARCFAHPINVNQIDSDYMVPSSEKKAYPNEFVLSTPKEHQQALAQQAPKPKIHSTQELMPAHAGDPHQTVGIADWRHVHYDTVREPTFPKKPDISKGELAAGATVTRTDVWHDPKEPAIVSVAKFSPENYRPVGWAENAPMPTTTVPEGHLDFRSNRLPLNHADRRPWIYFLAASTGFVLTSVARGVVCKLVHTMWPAKDVFAAGIVEVDIRPVQPGQNFVVKWRSKPVFIRRRTPDMITACKKDDAIVSSMRHPQTDAEICQKPEWLIVIGVCTHLGCIPQPDAGNFGGYFCPCHGSHYDFAGRIRQGPAPKNLEVPPVTFVDEGTVKLG
eukprot:TRINITY_DN823_c0_g3_i1.p1 TRINITY_DN823_c0_g3~~TRINITY_DN823_c0_g3_i1.p1  ORF type:complete len:354 (+),score=76.25 TRINITY_DN823_c0_g3_i1:154-1215(+)